MLFLIRSRYHSGLVKRFGDYKAYANALTFGSRFEPREQQFSLVGVGERVQVAMVMYEITDLQYQAVYNVLSFSPASMMATTLDVVSQNI